MKSVTHYAIALFIGLGALSACSSDKEEEPTPAPTPQEEQKEKTDPPAVTPPVITHSELEPFVNFGADVPTIKAMEQRHLRRDTTKVLYNWQTIRTLIYDGGDKDIAFYYYYHFKQAELYQSEMLCPDVPEVKHLVDSIFSAQYKYWRWSNAASADMYLTPDSSMVIQKEYWTDESSDLDLIRVLYSPISPEEIKEYYSN